MAVWPSSGTVVSRSRAMTARNEPRDAGERAQEGGDDEGEDGTTVPTLDPFGPAREPSHAPLTLFVPR